MFPLLCMRVALAGCVVIRAAGSFRPSRVRGRRVPVSPKVFFGHGSGVGTLRIDQRGRGGEVEIRGVGMEQGQIVERAGGQQQSGGGRNGTTHRGGNRRRRGHTAVHAPSIRTVRR